MRTIVFSLFLLAILAGCSAKEINAGFDGISNDISKAFNDSKDK